MAEKLLTLPLRRFMAYYVSTLDKRQIELQDAIAICKLDPEESFCHVQLNDLDTGASLDKPLLWNIADWRSDYEIYKHKRKQSSIQRIKWDIAKQNLDRISARLQEITFVDKEAADKMAEVILKKSNPVAIQNLGIKLASFNENMIPKDII